jgi:hypothetical protein
LERLVLKLYTDAALSQFSRLEVQFECPELEYRS